MLVKKVGLLSCFIFSILVFLINNLYILGSILLLEIFLTLLFKISLKSIRYLIIIILPMFLINLLFSEITLALLVVFRLLIMFFLVVILNHYISSIQIAYLFYDIFHSKDLFLIIAISISFIPIMRDEMCEIKKCLKVRGYKFNLKNSHLLFITFINNMFTKVSELEKIIISRGY